MAGTGLLSLRRRTLREKGEHELASFAYDFAVRGKGALVELNAGTAVIAPLRAAASKAPLLIQGIISFTDI
jgi:hypothetical protein